MHPELWTLPGGFTIRTYGLCMMIGFLSAAWLAMRRAQRVQADPDVVLDMSFLALLCGVAGARVFYVAHYWQTQFAPLPNKFVAIIDITQGGLEFLGGFVGAGVALVIYAKLIKKVSFRLYMDIVAPSVMWGLAIGRIGCFFNGCCFGGLCVAGPGQEPCVPWAVRFPYGSGAFVHQWEERKVTVPAELVYAPRSAIQAGLVPPQVLTMSVKELHKPVALAQADHALRDLRKRHADADEIARAEATLAAVRKAIASKGVEFELLRHAQLFPSRWSDRRRRISVSELQLLANNVTSLPVHPTQLYSSVHAFLLSGLLSAIFYRRKRHGVVIALLFVLYSFPRLLLEMIRADNPAHVMGLTISQFVSLGMLAAGVLALVVLYKYVPERSVHAASSPANAS